MECKEFDTVTLMSYFAGDLDSLTALRIANHIKQCTTCSIVVDSMEKVRAVFLKKYPVPSLPVNSSRTKMKVFTTRSMLSLAASLILIVTAGFFSFMHFDRDGYRIKGSTQMNIFVQDQNGIPAKRVENVYFPGEKIQFTYSCGSNRYFMLLSTDTSGAISVYYPTNGDMSIELEAGQDLPLPNSITLDNYTGPELYLAIFSALPLHAASVKDKLKSSLEKSRGLGSLHLNIENAEVRTVYITKKERAQ